MEPLDSMKLTVVLAAITAAPIACKIQKLE
jgi:hypothetical protein